MSDKSPIRRQLWITIEGNDHIFTWYRVNGNITYRTSWDGVELPVTTNHDKNVGRDWWIETCMRHIGQDPDNPEHRDRWPKPSVYQPKKRKQHNSKFREKKRNIRWETQRKSGNSK